MALPDIVLLMIRPLKRQACLFNGLIISKTISGNAIQNSAGENSVEMHKLIALAIPKTGRRVLSSGLYVRFLESRGQ